MKLFTHLVLDNERPEDGALNQRVARALSDAGYAGTVEGRKGSVRLPAQAYARIDDVTPDPEERASKTIERYRTRCVDELSALLDEAGFVGSFFASIARGTAWAFRPVPRHHKNQSDDESSADHPAIPKAAVHLPG